jgi:hypothetical protein
MDWSELSWIFALLMVGYLWGFFWGVCFQERQKIEVNSKIITGDIVGPGTGMFADNAILGQNLDPLVVWRKGNLMPMPNELPQNTSALIRQSSDVANSRPINRAPLPEAAPTISKPANNSQRRNSLQKPNEYVMPHSAYPPNEKS